jgi:hypothetical protein
MKENLKKLKLSLCLSVMKERRTGRGNGVQHAITPVVEGDEPSDSRFDRFSSEYPLVRGLGD